MGYNNEQTYQARPWCVFDLETAALPDVAQYLDPVEAARNLVDPVKIEADIKKRTADQAGQCALDWNTARIVALGFVGSWMSGPEIMTCVDETREAGVLREFAFMMSEHHPRLVGFCSRKFDAPMLLQRGRYLNIDMPRISLKRWDNPDMVDLFDLLTFDDAPATSVMRRSLTSFCRRFHLDVEVDSTTGHDIAALVAAEDWNGVSEHCRRDLQKTRLLAERLGVIQATADVF